MPWASKADKAAYDKAWRAKNPLHSGWLCLRGNAKKRHLDLTLTFTEYQRIASQPCHYCQDVFRKPGESGGGLDRIDNARGYSLDNVVPCCGFCNSVRGDVLTVEETRAAITAVVNLRRGIALAFSKPGAKEME